MSNAQGMPLWYEYMARDAAAAQHFYSMVIGWTVRDSDMPGLDYRLAAAADGDDIAGLMTQPKDMPGGPVWLIYFATDDVDATAARAAELGGDVLMPPMTIEGVGRMAMLADPQRHPFYVMRGESQETSNAYQDSRSASTGHAVWNELTAEDQDAAMAFYAELLGLRHEGAMPMGPFGDYKFIEVGPRNGDESCGAIGASMNVTPNGRRGWQVYFQVDDVDAAVDRLKAAGGSVIQGPDQIPGGTYSVVAEDHDGARFGFVGPRR